MIESPQENFNDKLDILKHVSDIKLALKEDITNDFVLAKLGDKDKEFIIEMTGNAYFSKRLLEEIKEKGTKWVYDINLQQSVKIKLEKKEIDEIDTICKAVFHSYMVKIYMTVILNRNVDKNYLINVLSGYDEGTKEGEITTNQQMKGMMSELLGDKSKGEEK